MDTEITILVVDSHDDRRETTREQLADEDRFTVYTVDSVEGAKRSINTMDVDCIVSEQQLGDGTAMSVFEHAAKDNPEVGRIILTADDQVPPPHGGHGPDVRTCQSGGT